MSVASWQANSGAGDGELVFPSARAEARQAHALASHRWVLARGCVGCFASRRRGSRSCRQDWPSTRLRAWTSSNIRRGASSEWEGLVGVGGPRRRGRATQPRDQTPYTDGLWRRVRLTFRDGKGLDQAVEELRGILAIREAAHPRRGRLRARR
jgi:hypothetical protein